jgi:HK97 family phage major capsid protein
MALTLAEAAKLSEDVLLKGVIEIVIKDSPILQKLPFIEVVGNSLKYTQENALPTVAFYAVGDAWAESTPTFTLQTATLTILGGDADVDNYLQQTRSNYQDIEAAVIELKAKAMRHKFEDTFINGDGTSNSFSGIDTLCTGGQIVSMGTNGNPLDLRYLDQLIDKVLGGKPEMLLMSRRSRRDLTHLMRQLGSMEFGQDEFGNWVQFFNGIPVHTNDWISDAKTVGTSGDCSTIYAFQVGEGAVCGLQNKGIQVERIGELETKDATRTRLKWYCSLASFSTVKLAKLVGVRPVA